MSVWEGRRVVIVGASSGIGRGVALRMIRGGADVILTARRSDKLDEVVAEAGGGTVVAVDIADDPAALVAAVGNGSIDVLLFSAGTAALRPLVEMDRDTWNSILAVNTVGINTTIAALAARLTETSLVVALSSESVNDPLWGLAAYAASKAALESSFTAWKQELPGTRFCCLSMGATLPSDFGNYLDPQRLGEAFGHWMRNGYAPQVMATDDVAEAMVGMLSSIIRYPQVNIEYAMIRAPHTAAPADLAAEAARNDLAV